ncbi:hypothetical protein CI102_14224 [Trichoderma harzianum]|uniref:Uncharacterized protein n=1 Tax=Trichoderma harzianum CBS 226.95 TaxID=983964 RepID=A0A2T4A6T0_TRIHA|nr:hypothetical protein M431DRAFT_471587 [Trichoderma harzianum CBS 226.95]PKK41193.1 hypothetical protein CI102_14224 [Trichoderma harzianum]PTB52770.1 hypothetical protein M431DRAFT_471587 [Trichoderma harzianum CBS 226.95]
MSCIGSKRKKKKKRKRITALLLPLVRTEIVSTEPLICSIGVTPDSTATWADHPKLPLKIPPPKALRSTNVNATHRRGTDNSSAPLIGNPPQDTATLFHHTQTSLILPSIYLIPFFLGRMAALDLVSASLHVSTRTPPKPLIQQQLFALTGPSR